MVAAQLAGYYADRGLEVDIVSPANPADPIKLVASGQVEFSLTYVPEIMLAHEAGIPVISVATTLRVLSSGLFFLTDREIDGPEDLSGMTLGVGPKQDAQAFLDTVLEAGGLTRDDVEVVDPGYAHIPMILAGQIDAAHGLTYSEGMAAAEAEGEGRHPLAAVQRLRGPRLLLPGPRGQHRVDRGEPEHDLPLPRRNDAGPGGLARRSDRGAGADRHGQRAVHPGATPGHLPGDGRPLGRRWRRPAPGRFGLVRSRRVGPASGSDHRGSPPRRPTSPTRIWQPSKKPGRRLRAAEAAGSRFRHHQGSEGWR